MTVANPLQKQPARPGPFAPDWDSLSRYQVPEWFRDAKFGLWAHWGPQCQPERGDWYARNMYIQGHPQYQYHLATYGHPSQFGFKDVIRQWKAQNWDPDRLMAIYRRAGARYFMAMANHHDNFDLWDSTYQPWNSTRIGPMRNIIGEWAAAARRHGLRFGVSVHASHAWIWFEPAQGADKDGPFAGVPYDGKLTAQDGRGQWWEGLDPQDLYAQNHPRSSEDPSAIHHQWDWSTRLPPDPVYLIKFYNRMIELIDKYQPDLIYFDDTVLPFWPISNVGLEITAHFYNSHLAWHGRLDAVVFGKILNDQQKRCLVWDIERGVSNRIEPLPWQTCTCLGNWHYDRTIYERKAYKSARTVIHMLADIVSKNGNLLLSVPVRADGTLDELELKILEEIGQWLEVNGEAIYGTRPWKVFGEGPASQAPPLSAQGFNEGGLKPFTAQDIRFTCKGQRLYAIVLGWPDQPIRISSLGRTAGYRTQPVRSVQLLGSPEPLSWHQADEVLIIQPPKQKISDIAIVFQIE